MSKTTGLGDNFFIGGIDLSGDVASLESVHGGPNALDVTGIKKSAHERLGGERDGEMQFTSFFNPSAGAAHPTLSALPRTDVVATYLRGAALGNACCSLIGKQIDYLPTRADDGGLTLKVDLEANGFGIEWGNQLVNGLRTDTTGTTGSTVDETAGTSLGAQAYLQVTGVTGTSVTVKIRHSTDNSTFSDLISFTAATGATAQRLAVTGTVNRYLKVVTSGTFTNASFLIHWSRNATAVSF